jgi:glutaminyl-tRNA synthetase
MRAGEFADGTRVLRAKIDMASPNINLRDPVLYRILHATHHRTGDTWCIYPMYDYAHPQSDCAREDHPLDLHARVRGPPAALRLVRRGAGDRPAAQIEFARLNVTYTVMSKRKLLQAGAGEGSSPAGTIRACRLSPAFAAAACPPAALRDFCERIGVAKQENGDRLSLLEHCVREELNKHAPSAAWPCSIRSRSLIELPRRPGRRARGGQQPGGSGRWHATGAVLARDLHRPRRLPRGSAEEVLPPVPGREVRLRWAYIIRCEEVVKDADGRIVEIRCTYDAASRGGTPADGRKVKGTIHWVSAQHAVDAEVRLYDHLFANADPDDVPEGVDFLQTVNPKSLEILTAVKVEPSLAALPPGTRVQFERTGYFVTDTKDHRPGESGIGRPVFNRITTLRDTWAKVQKNEPKAG